MATPQLASFKVPAIDNEPMVSVFRIQFLHITYRPQKSYAPGSAERHALAATITQMEQELPFEVPCIVNGLQVCNNPCNPSLLVPITRLLRSRQARSPNNPYLTTTHVISAPIMKQMKPPSQKPSMVHSPQKKNGKAYLGTIVLLFSSRLQILSAESIDTSS